MAVDLAGKTILVLSDNNGLARAIEVNLRNSQPEVIRLVLDSPEGRYNLAPTRHVDLVVLAMSSPYSEPLVALARASLLERIGQVPILIISDRPFRFGPSDRVSHLDFPFDIDKLCERVQAILQGMSNGSGPPARPPSP